MHQAIVAIFKNPARRSPLEQAGHKAGRITAFAHGEPIEVINPEALNYRKAG